MVSLPRAGIFYVAYWSSYRILLPETASPGRSSLPPEIENRSAKILGISGLLFHQHPGDPFVRSNLELSGLLLHQHPGDLFIKNRCVRANHVTTKFRSFFPSDVLVMSPGSGKENCNVSKSENST